MATSKLSVCSRRTFIAGAAGLISGAANGEQAAAKTLDIHVHLFGVGDAGSGCRMSKTVTDGFLFQGLVYALGLRSRAKTIDEAYERALTEHAAGSGLAKVAILGQDAVYGRDGKPNWDATHFYVPNEHVFAVAQRHREMMVPCPSINPNRSDALDELERCRERGAKLLKIHPPTQGVDVADRRHTKFFRRCADLGMIVMVHTGHEHAAPIIDKHLAAPKRLELALELGCTVVACHAGTGRANDKPDQLPDFLQMLKRYPKLWGDTAVLGDALRVRDFGRLLDAPGAPDRLLHGSDFPFPVAPTAFASRIGASAADRLNVDPNWIKKDYGLKVALGVGRASAERGYKLVLGESR